MKNSINAVNAAPLYPGFTRETASFATYNCCSNGTKPYDASVDCNSTNGFGTIPKWACPIDHGNTTSGMCVVKNYACELTVCLQQL